MISELWITITNQIHLVKQDFAVVKQDFAVVKQVDGRTAHMTDTTRHQSWQSTPPPPPPLPYHAGPIPALNTTWISFDSSRALESSWNLQFKKNSLV
jgi:hypothetical protein